MMVEDETKIDSKLDDYSELVEKVNDIPEASEKETDNNLKEKASLEDIYVPKAADIENKELCDDPSCLIILPGTWNRALDLKWSHPAICQRNCF